MFSQILSLIKPQTLLYYSIEAAEGAKDPAETDESDDDEDLSFFGVGGDLLEAFFPDDEPAKKKVKPTEAPIVPAPNVPAVVAADEAAAAAAAAVEEVKPVATKTKPAKKSSAKKPAAKKPAIVAPAEDVPVAVEKAPLGSFQHTPALLQLAQSNKKGTIEESVKSEENEVVGSGPAINQIAGQLLDSNENHFTADESDDDGMIFIGSSELHPVNSLENVNKQESVETAVQHDDQDVDEENDEEDAEIEADEEGMWNIILSSLGFASSPSRCAPCASPISLP